MEDSDDEVFDDPILINARHTKPKDAVILMDKDSLTFEKIVNLGEDHQINALCFVNGVVENYESDMMGKAKALYGAIVDRGISFSVQADAKTMSQIYHEMQKKWSDENSELSDDEKIKTIFDEQGSPDFGNVTTVNSPNSLFGQGPQRSGADPNRPNVTLRDSNRKITTISSVKQQNDICEESDLNFNNEQIKKFIELRGSVYKNTFDGKKVGYKNILNDMGLTTNKENISRCKKKWIHLRDTYRRCLIDENLRARCVDFVDLDKVLKSDNTDTSQPVSLGKRKQLQLDSQVTKKK